jgi:hypothetical protein
MDLPLRTLRKKFLRLIQSGSGAGLPLQGNGLVLLEI